MPTARPRPKIPRAAFPSLFQPTPETSAQTAVALRHVRAQPRAQRRRCTQGAHGRRGRVPAQCSVRVRGRGVGRRAPKDRSGAFPLDPTNFTVEATSQHVHAGRARVGGRVSAQRHGSAEPSAQTHSGVGVGFFRGEAAGVGDLGAVHVDDKGQEGVDDDHDGDEVEGQEKSQNGVRLEWLC